MKIRIKGNSVRMRLTRSEVSNLAATGYLQEQTGFVNEQLIYALHADENTTALMATFANNKITLFVPAAFVKAWPDNNIVGLDATMPLPENGTLYLLIEKDFVCLDHTTEDQSDNYENPNRTC